MPDPKVQLDELPVAIFEQSFTYLKDVLRELQFVLVDAHGGRVRDAGLVNLALDLVPDVEAIIRIVRSAERTDGDGELFALSVEVPVRAVEVLRRVPGRLRDLSVFGERGELLLEVDDEMTNFLDWIWQEVEDQLGGERPGVFQRD